MAQNIDPLAFAAASRLLGFGAKATFVAFMASGSMPYYPEVMGIPISKEEVSKVTSAYHRALSMS